jgi:quinolinate synthase
MAISTQNKQLIDEINQLKQEKRAVILVHNYQRQEIFDVADFTGDSLGLCLESRKVDCDMIVFSGVHFMAESAKILNPDKKVVVPHIGAGCKMADMITAEALRVEKLKYPNAAVVCYVNSTADVKAESDVMCTSTNAVEVVRALPNDEILFVPDKNLASYVARAVPDKKIIPWEGYCPMHHLITPEHVDRVMKDHPNGKLIAHPECTPGVRDKADYVCSTSKMMDVAEKDPAQDFVIITECGMINRMKRSVPNKSFTTTCSICFDMKKNTLERVRDSLLYETEEVIVPDDIQIKALAAFELMFALTNTNEPKRTISQRVGAKDARSRQGVNI